jgi:predicted site-specific integrase-resolvase
VPIDDLDRSLNAGDVARFWGISMPTLNRDVREGRHPPADYTNGQYRFWKLSTLIRARERRIAESAHKAAAQRQEQLNAAARARTAQRQKRERQATTDAA